MWIYAVSLWLPSERSTICNVFCVEEAHLRWVLWKKRFFYVKEAHFRSEKIESILLSTEKRSISIKK